MREFLLLVTTSLLATTAFASAAPPQQPSAAGADTAPPAKTASHWVQYRGPDRSGISPETGLLRSWPAEGPKVVWRRSIGEGFSGIVTSGEYLYTLWAVGEDEVVGCLRSADGTEVWRRRIGAAFGDEFGNGPRATPTVDQRVVYALGGRGKLMAADAATGEPIWEVDLHTAEYGFYGPQLTTSGLAVGFLQLPQFGYAASPLVEGELIVVGTGRGKGSSYVAFDKSSGKPRWTSIEEPGFTYSSPMAVNIGGHRQILVLTPSQLVSLRPDGEILWSQPWAETIAQPVFVSPDKVFVSTTNIAGSRSEGGAMALKIHERGGEAQVETLWESRIMRNYSSSSVAYQGFIYGFDNATLRCVAADSGELRWARRGLGKGTLIVADGLLILWSDRGRLTLAEASPEGYEQKGQAQILEEGQTWTPPTIAGGKLYLRGRTDLVCLNLKE